MSTPPVKAPDWPAHLEWFNTERPLTLAELRGKAVLLHFWRYGSIDCVHSLAELRQLQKKFPDEVAVIGVHVPELAAERDSTELRKAINRHHLQHPVLQDAGLEVFRRFRIRTLPMVVYIDTRGYIVGALRDMLKVRRLEKSIAEDLAQAEAEDRHNRAPLPLKPQPEAMSVLKFPGKLLATETRLYISDSALNRVLEVDRGGRVRRTFGSGSAGLVDGQGGYASFDNPQGLARIGEDLYVADAGNQVLRRIRLDRGEVDTVARWEGQAAASPAAYPWDLIHQGGVLYIAMAGLHQLWTYTLSTARLSAYAGTGQPALQDGSARGAGFSQPCGLASLDDVLFVADAGASAIRTVRPASLGVATLCGGSSGPAGGTDLQHPMALAADGARQLLWIADSYNSRLQLLSLRDGRIKDFPVDHALDQPAGLSLAGDSLFVANTNAHEILELDTVSGTVRMLDIDEG